MTTSLPTIVATYFDIAAQADTEAYLSLFADDAVVKDEGKTYHGIDAIRGVRTCRWSVMRSPRLITNPTAPSSSPAPYAATSEAVPSQACGSTS